MSIVFPCPGCDKLLTMPDETAGKQAECPLCQNIATIPSQTVSRKQPTASGSANPYQDDHVYQSPTPLADVVDPANPYRSPTGFPEQTRNDASKTAKFAPRAIQFADVMKTARSLFLQHRIPLIVLGIVLTIVWFVLHFAGAAIQESTAVENDPEAMLTVVFGYQIMRNLISLVFNVGAIRVTLGIIRGKSDLPKLLTVFGWFLKGVGVWLLTTGAILAASLIVLLFFFAPFMIVSRNGEVDSPYDVLFAGWATTGYFVSLIPILWIALTLFLANYFVVDRNDGVLASLDASRRFMRGNQLAALGLNLSLGIVGGSIVLITLGVGMIVVLPFAYVMWTVIYLRATDQPIPTESG